MGSILLAWLVFTIPLHPPAKPLVNAPAFITFIDLSTDSIESEQAALNDLSPLFIQTSLNDVPNAINIANTFHALTHSHYPKPLLLIRHFHPEKMGEKASRPHFASLANYLLDHHWNFLSIFGQNPYPINTALASRNHVLTFTDTNKSTEMTFHFPASVLSKTTYWEKPIIGTLIENHGKRYIILESHSGIETIDSAVKSFLQTSPNIQLSPGTYKFTIGP